VEDEAMNEPRIVEPPGWGAQRVPGDPRFVRLLCNGAVPMPALTTARARWEARQAEAYGDVRTRARMLLPILDQFNEETQGRFLALTLAQLRHGLADLATEGDADE
jgi:hypothetical protein